MEPLALLMARAKGRGAGVRVPATAEGVITGVGAKPSNLADSIPSSFPPFLNSSLNSPKASRRYSLG